MIHEERERLYDEEKARREIREQLELEEKQKSVKAGCIGCGVLIVIALGIAALSGTVGSSKNDAPKDHSTMAYLKAQRFIKDQLRSPSSAEFPGLMSGEWRVITLEDGTYVASGWVDAQNAFGVTVRSRWTCHVQRLGDDAWRTAGACEVLR